jgi:hypothetical protein
VFIAIINNTRSNVCAGVNDTSDKLLPVPWRLRFVPDSHQLHDTGDKIIACKNDTGDDYSLITTTSTIIYRRKQ